MPRGGKQRQAAPQQAQSRSPHGNHPFANDRQWKQNPACSRKPHGNHSPRRRRRDTPTASAQRRAAPQQVQSRLPHGDHPFASDRQWKQNPAHSRTATNPRAAGGVGTRPRRARSDGPCPAALNSDRQRPNRRKAVHLTATTLLPAIGSGNRTRRAAASRTATIPRAAPASTPAQASSCGRQHLRSRRRAERRKSAMPAGAPSQRRSSRSRASASSATAYPPPHPVRSATAAYFRARTTNARRSFASPDSSQRTPSANSATASDDGGAPRKRSIVAEKKPSAGRSRSNAAIHAADGRSHSRPPTASASNPAPAMARRNAGSSASALAERFAARAGRRSVPADTLAAPAPPHTAIPSPRPPSVPEARPASGTFAAPAERFAARAGRRSVPADTLAAPAPPHTAAPSPRPLSVPEIHPASGTFAAPAERFAARAGRRSVPADTLAAPAPPHTAAPSPRPLSVPEIHPASGTFAAPAERFAARVKTFAALGSTVPVPARGTRRSSASGVEIWRPSIRRRFPQGRDASPPSTARCSRTASHCAHGGAKRPEAGSRAAIRAAGAAGCRGRPKRRSSPSPPRARPLSSPIRQKKRRFRRRKMRSPF